MDIERHNNRQIERLNQRGGRMLSIVDLIQAGTLNVEMAACAMRAMEEGASLLTAARPGGAGKTTLMAVILSFLPPGVELITVDSSRVIEDGLGRSTDQSACYLVHEIGSGDWYGYLWGADVAGPFAPPGAYRVRLSVDGRVRLQPLVVKRHPLRSATDADLKEQFDLAIQIRDKTSEANNAVIRIRDLKSQVADRLGQSSDAKLKAAGDKFTASLSAVEGEIYQVKNQSGQDPLNFPIKVNNRLASLLQIVTRGDSRPIGNAPVIFKDLVAELKVQTDALAKVLASGLPAFNTEATRLGLAAVK